jgi:PAS domain S-box-containing protein
MNIREQMIKDQGAARSESIVQRLSSDAVHVLLIEDDPGYSDVIQIMLEKVRDARFDVVLVNRLSEGLERLRDETINVVLVDLKLPDSQGIDTFDKVYAQAPDVPIIVLTVTDNDELALEAVQKGAQDYLVKEQVDATLLVRAIRYAIERKQKEESPKKHRGHIEQQVEECTAELQESEAKFRGIFENVPLGIVRSDMEGRILDSNPAFQSFIGYLADELRNMRTVDVMHPDDWEEGRGLMSDMLVSSDNAFIGEKRYITKDGTTVWANLTISIVRHPNGVPHFLLSMVEDITQRKLAEDAQKISEERFRSIVENSRAGIIMVDDDYMITFLNDALCRIFGYACEELLGHDFRDFLDEKSKHFIADRYLRRQRGEDIPTRYDCCIVRKDGEKRLVEINSAVIKNFEGKVETIGQIVDVTERKLAEEVLRESEERYRTLFEQSKDVIFVTSHEGKILNVNQAMLDLFGYTREEMLEMKAQELYVDSADRIRYLQLIKPEGVVQDFEVKLRKKDGTEMDCLLTASVRKADDGSIRGYQGIIRDITGRKRAEEQLHGQALIFENINDGIIVTDLEGNIMSWNPAAKKLFGYDKDELIRKTIGEMATKVVTGTLHDGRWTGELDFTRKDGTAGVCETTVFSLRDANGTITAVCGVFRDITERKRSEEILQKSYDQLRETLIATVNTLASTIEMRDPYTAGHQRRVTLLACAIAEEMGLTEDQFDGLRMAGLIHDLGKINVPAEILSKPGRINEIEFNIIRYHPQICHDILKTIELPWPVAKIVLQHHERLDGSGYPQGLKGDQIMLEAKILAVADVVEAMASHRPYRPALGITLALEEISKNRGVLYEPAVVDACKKIFKEKKFRFE